MVYCKVVMDVGVQICVGSIVMVMICNGDMFGIWVSGLGDCWFIVFVNMLQGLFFIGFLQDQVNLDMGDSVIIEMFGIGGVVMIVVSGVMCFVGVGGMEVVKFVFEEMVEIYFECNMQL